MNKAFRVILIGCSLLLACKATQQTTSAPANKNTHETASLNGTWKLNYISGSRIAFQGLYPEKKPVITFDVANNQFGGNPNCHSYWGKLIVDGSKINFPEPMAITRMRCPGQGESAFVETLKKITSYTVSEGNTLNLIMGDITLMRFAKK